MTLHARGGLLLALWLLAGLAQAGTRHYYYTDPQGTPLAKTDANGTIIATYDYAPYGTAVAGMSGAPDGPGYTGHVNDPDTGFVYMQARYYDPERGGFLSVDPVTPSPGNTFNFNRYDYVSNNPIINIDPDGRQKFSGYGSTLKIDGDCHQANNCQTMDDANAMVRKDAEDIIKFEGKIIVSAGTAAIAIPRVVLVTIKTATYVQAQGKKMGPPCIFAAASLGCNPMPVNAPSSAPPKSTADASWVETMKRLEEIRRLSHTEIKPKVTQEPPPPPPPPPPQLRSPSPSG